MTAASRLRPRAGLTAVPPAVPVVAVCGAGRLARAIADAVSRCPAPGPVSQAATLAEVPPGVQLLITATDAWDTRCHEEVRARHGAMPWLPVRTELGRAVIGPLQEPGRAGCVRCAGQRADRIRPHREGYLAARGRHAAVLAGRPSAWLTPLAADTVAVAVAAEARRVVTGRPPRLRGAVLVVNLRNLTAARHPFLPDPLCPDCGGLPGDTADGAVLAITSRPTPAPGSYRVGHATAAGLRAAYVDAEAGLIPEIRTGHSGGLAVARAPLGLRSHRTDVAGYGRTPSYQDSELVAVFEALERYGGLAPGGKRTTVTAGYAGMADRALDPRQLGLYPPDRYELPGFRCRPFDPERPLSWVWAYSLTRGEPVLVPQLIAYYGLQDLAGEPPLAYECSSGCALGSCLEEAVLHAILEVAERDAFLLTWYGRLPAPRVDLGSAASPQVPLAAATIERETGYRVGAYDITVDHGIPCACVLAWHPGEDPGRAKAACAAAAHPDPERAILNALGELGPMLANLTERYPQLQDRAAGLVTDPDRVVSMSDHSLLAAHPAAFGRLSFLTAAQDARPVAKSFGPDRRLRPAGDLAGDLAQLAERFAELGLDVLVVDQTTPEHRVTGLACVKVLIPGTLPMTFGHRYRRTDGLPRLHAMPQLLGHSAGPLDPAQVNPDPHPFP